MLPDPEAVAAKSELRLRLLTRRTERPDAERAAAADALTRALLEGLAGARTVAAFVPDPIEPGAGRLPEAYARLGARILLPVVPDVGRELRWAEHTGPLAPGRFGLLEPVGPRLEPDAIGEADVVVVPRWRWPGTACGWAAAAGTTTGRCPWPAPTPSSCRSSSTTNWSTTCRPSRTTDW